MEEAPPTSLCEALRAGNEWGQLPASEFTPIPLETLDWDKAHAEMQAIELKLARVKVLFQQCFPIEDRQSQIENEPLGGS